MSGFNRSHWKTICMVGLYLDYNHTSKCHFSYFCCFHVVVFVCFLKIQITFRIITNDLLEKYCRFITMSVDKKLGVPSPSTRTHYPEFLLLNAVFFVWPDTGSNPRFTANEESKYRAVTVAGFLWCYKPVLLFQIKSKCPFWIRLHVDLFTSKCYTSSWNSVYIAQRYCLVCSGVCIYSKYITQKWNCRSNFWKIGESL